MQQPVSLKSAERKAFRATFADGLWDVMIGCVFLMFAVAPLLSESLGDFWSSVIFLPFWGLVYLAIWLTRRYVVAPRIGKATLGKPRQRRLVNLGFLMVIINILLLLIGMLAVFIFPSVSGFLMAVILGVVLLFGFSAAAYFLDYPRFYLYGLLLFTAALVGEWLYQNYGVSHHGYPLCYGFVSGVMIVTGLVTFGRLLKDNPLVEVPVEAA